MTHYRILKLGEWVQAGDQFQCPDTGDWLPVQMSGFQIQLFDLPHRRVLGLLLRAG